MFSVPLFRSHATVCLVDRDRLQLYHANRSVILVSSAINFSSGDGLDKFIAVFIAFQCLLLKQCGIMEELVRENAEPVTDVPTDYKLVHVRNKTDISDGPGNPYTLSLGQVISREPLAVGRSTGVIKASSDKWPDAKLVVKMSWPTSDQVPETEFIQKAAHEAENTDGQWAAKHLPRVYFARDADFGPDSTFALVERLFKDAKFAGGEFVYERRDLRIIIQEELHPLKSLSNARDMGQVFVDVACSTWPSLFPIAVDLPPTPVHRWLYDCPGILHCDLSSNNIMCRILKEPNAAGELERKVYGVLTDYDLSSWTKDLKNDHTMTSQEWTGTPPYMALELLKGLSRTRLYRHDVESLFYIMLLMCGRYTFGYAEDRLMGEETRQVIMRKGMIPYQNWFRQADYNMLGNTKSAFFMHQEVIELSPAFTDFRPWLETLQTRFRRGFSSKSFHKGNAYYLGDSTDYVVPFDDEKLGGHIDYPSFIEPIHRLTGQLQGLAVRYTPPPSPPASVGATGVRLMSRVGSLLTSVVTRFRGSGIQ